MIKRLIAMLMTAILLITAVPVVTFAEEIAAETDRYSVDFQEPAAALSESMDDLPELTAELSESTVDLLASSDRINAIYASMSQAERIAQMFMMQARSWKGNGAVTTLDDDLKAIYAEYKFGAFISFADNMKDTVEILNMSKDLQKAVTGNGGVPMIIATDQEGGRVQRIGTGTPMPGNMAVAAAGNPSDAYISGESISQELDALGYNCTLAPDLDINSNPGNPVIATRAFGDTAEIVSAYGTEFLKGLKAQNTIACMKHFAGHGDTDVDSHTGCPLVQKTWAELKSFELIPFMSAIQQNAEMVMIAHIIYPEVDNTKITATKGEHAGEEVGIPATLSHKILTEKLRGELGFDGVICTDSMGMAGVSSILETPDRVARAINAGADLICMPLPDSDIENPAKFRENVNALIAYVDEHVPDARIEDAVKRILTLKEQNHILDYDESLYTRERALSTVGCDEFRQKERDMAADGVTLVKNAGNALPLHIGSDSRVLMLVQDHKEGYNEQYAAQFIMGWNRAKAAGLIPVSASVDVVMFDKDDWNNADKLAAIDNADYIFMNSIVRNKNNMAYKKWQTAAPKKYSDYAKAKGKKSFVISIDAPYDVQLFPNADGIFAIYNLTGSKEDWQDVLDHEITTSKNAMGANLVGAVEVALGVYGANGKLPVNIYRFATESDAYEMDHIVYERGFGIEYDPITSMDQADASLAFTEAEYTGSEIRPQVMVRVDTRHTDGKILTEGRDYSVHYLNNVEIGTATVRIDGMGSYVGSKSVNFRIVAKKSGSTPAGGSNGGNTGSQNHPISSGTWNYDPAADQWSYVISTPLTNTWGYIVNPYAGNEPAWFYFDKNGNMLTGWQLLYWNGKFSWYYFNQNHDGRYGACQLGGITPDGHLLDASGALVM